MNEESPIYYEFGPFRLSVSDRLLTRGDEVVSLTPKVMDTLLLLVENRGHVLTKGALLETLWPGSFVEESSVTQNISLLRRKLAGNGATHEYIETIPKRGYRFRGDVIEVKAHNNGNANGPFIREHFSTAHSLRDDSAVPGSREVLPDSVIEKSSSLSDTKVRALVGFGFATVVLMSSLISYWFGSRRSGPPSTCK